MKVPLKGFYIIKVMPTISTDAFIEYFMWMIFIYIFPTFISAALVTTILNSAHGRDLFITCIQIANEKVINAVNRFERDHLRKETPL